MTGYSPNSFVIQDITGSHHTDVIRHNALRRLFILQTNVGDITVAAVGVLFYRRVNSEIMFLMQKTHLSDEKFRYDDFGGKIEMDSDQTIFDTVVREVGEESNWKLTFDPAQTTRQLFFENGGYFLFIAEMTQDIEGCDFGTKEEHDGYMREVVWITRDQLVGESTPIHPRLWQLQFFTAINAL